VAQRLARRRETPDKTGLDVDDHHPFGPREEEQLRVFASLLMNTGVWRASLPRSGAGEHHAPSGATVGDQGLTAGRISSGTNSR
jgi:hypothetical protein